jgi:hypothetical protein
MDPMPILLLAATYLVAREAVQGWHALLILIALTSALIILANLAGLDQTVTVSGSKTSFKATYFDNAAVILASVLMLIAQKVRQKRRV